MPVTFKVYDHDSEPFVSTQYEPLGVDQPVDVLRKTWEPGTRNEEPDTKKKTVQSCKELLQSSIKDCAELKNFSPKNNGFIQSIITAHNQHHNLIIRPDDIWIAVLSQLNLYFNANAESLRSKFVFHEGKEKIIVRTLASEYDIDYASVADTMTKLMKERIVDPGLRDLIVPNFSTTTPVDKTIGCIMMMSNMKQYFDYEIQILCGIPSITLLGTKEDYEEILRRITKFHEFGKEPEIFAALLGCIIGEFIKAFDNDANGKPQNLDFWKRICHYDPTTSAGGSGNLSGWSAAFCVWGAGGEWQGPGLMSFGSPISTAERLKSENYYFNRPRPQPSYNREPLPDVFFGDIRFPVVPLYKIPNGYCEVDILITDGTGVVDKANAVDDSEAMHMMVAGHFGFMVSGKKRDTVQPSPQWFIFEKEVTQVEDECRQQ